MKKPMQKLLAILVTLTITVSAAVAETCISADVTVDSDVDKETILLTDDMDGSDCRPDCDEPPKDNKITRY